MKILFLNPVGVIGGAERVLLDMVASLRRAQPDLQLQAIIGTNGPLLQELHEAGAEATLLPMPAVLAGAGDSTMIGSVARPSRLRLAARSARASAAAARYALQLRRCIRQLKPDLVHSNGNKFHLLSRLALGRSWPVVWHIHDFLGERPLLRRIVRRVAGGVCGAVAVSEAVARDARPLLDNVPIEVILNAVDIERFAPGVGDGPALDRLAGLPAANRLLRIGLVATYARWKGQEVFLDAVTKLPADLPARCYIIGGPIYQTAGSQFTEAQLRQAIAARGLERRVGLIGFQTDTPAIYRALDIVVHASTRPEPFGLTIAEAMACGRPVIVAAAGGAAELFTEGRDALGVAPGDAASLAAAMGRLAEDVNFRQHMSAAARQTALTRFSRDRLGPQLLAAYHRFGP